ncbi:MAG: glycosyltransferase family 4 protein, partial [Planctomycetota bacterium]
SGKHNDEQVLKKTAVSLVHGLLGRVPTRTIPLSDHVARFVARYGRIDPSKMTRIYYGIDRTPFEEAAVAEPAAKLELRRSLGFAEDDIVFICVARFAAQKAHDVLLRAFASAQKTNPKLRLLLVGGDPFGDGVERAQALSRELKLEGRVVFAGIRRDVPALLAASDVFVMASLWEGLGLVFLEAMATQMPVLATDVSAVPEVVIDGETGRLVAPGEDEPLRGAFLELGSDAGLRARWAEAGAARVAEHFTLERMWEETLAVYEEVDRAARS